MPEPPAYNPATQYLDTIIDINGVATYEVRDKPQVDIEDTEDFAFLTTFMGTPKADVTQLQALLALKALIRIQYRMAKVD